MNKFDRMLKELQESADVQDGCWEECIPDKIWDEFFRDCEFEIVDVTDVIEDKWHIISTVVVEMFGRLLGIRKITIKQPKVVSYKDLYHKLEYFELEMVKRTIIYKRKEK